MSSSNNNNNEQVRKVLSVPTVKKRPLLTKAVVDDDGAIVGYALQPGAGTRYVEYNPDYEVAQQSIKKRLGIKNVLSQDAALAIGGCLRDAREVLIDRFMDMGDAPRDASDPKTWPMLSNQVAQSAIFETVEDPHHHAEVVRRVQDALDAYSAPVQLE